MAVGPVKATEGCGGDRGWVVCMEWLVVVMAVVSGNCFKVGGCEWMECWRMAVKGSC